MSILPPLIEVTPQTADAVLRGLPTIARRAIGYAQRIEWGRLTLVLPDGRRLLFAGPQGGPRAILVVNDFAFARRLISAGDIGFAEAYIRGEWDSPDVAGFLELFSANRAVIERMLLHAPLARLFQNLRHWLNRNSRAGSRRNVHAHYDLGNAFYAQWLDRTMTYSSAMFGPHDDDLSAAQAHKYRHLARANRHPSRRQGSRDRLRLGRLCRARRQGDRGPGDRPHHLARAARLRAQADLRGGPRGPGRDQAAGLSRRDRHL